MSLRSGIEEYEKNVLNFIVEYMNTYVADLLIEAKQNASHADRNKINIEDIK